MAYKQRGVPEEIIILSILNARIELARKDINYYSSLKKGYDGEFQFDSMTEKLQCDCIILHDLLLKVNNNTIQIDTLIITRDQIYVFEVKNYDGDYYYESDKFYKKPHYEITNPLHQLARSEILLHQLLKSIGYHFNIKSNVIFVNPTFTLYQAPLDKPIIYPTQIKSYLNQINSTSTKLTKKHFVLAEKLCSLHQTESQYSQLPEYHNEQLQKGITCKKCQTLNVYVENRKCICKNCEHEEKLESAVLRSVKEFKLLFPNQKVTTNKIHDWCKDVPKRTIARILKRNFNMIGVHQWAYYE